MVSCQWAVGCGTGNGGLTPGTVVDYDRGVSEDPDRMEPQRLDYTSSSSSAPAGGRDGGTWFGYIGLGIAVAAMLVGFVGMVLFVLYFLRA